MASYYVAHRLFAAHDRALGAFIAHHLARRFGQDAVFLPFCDTDEETLVDPCKGKRLFELDCQRLPHLDGMIAVLHGPSLDDGMCMEIGYAAALGVPIVAVTTDFQTYAQTLDAAARSLFPDPLLQLLVSAAITEPQLGPTQTAAATDRFEDFLHRNLAPLATAARSATDAFAEISRTVPLPPAPDDGRLIYLEPSPYGPSQWVDTVAHLLAERGWDIHIAHRLRLLMEPDAAEPSPAYEDWQALGHSTIAVVDVHGAESPPGAAIIVGACQATGRHVYAPDPNCGWTFAPGREPNFRNLMIQYGLTGIFRRPHELANILRSPETFAI